MREWQGRCSLVALRGRALRQPNRENTPKCGSGQPCRDSACYAGIVRPPRLSVDERPSRRRNGNRVAWQKKICRQTKRCKRPGRRGGILKACFTLESPRKSQCYA
jgi:hypothetical protein